MPLYVPDKVNMNYANMIEEKNLKKTFIIATLVSTLVGTFAASHNLYDRLTQKKKDANQDGAIKKLEEKLDQMSKNKDGGSSKKDDLKEELNTSGRLIKREYDGAYDRLGRRFAAGDILTENELQKQIILLQQTVIGVLEDALYNGRQIDRAGVKKLVWASRAAREGSLHALQGQYQRIVEELPIPRPLPKAVQPVVIELSSRASSPRRSPVKALPPPPSKPDKAASSSRPPPPRRKSGRDYYCRYSVELQLSPRPLSKSFEPSKGSACPVCSTRLAVDSADMWEFRLPASAQDPGPPAKSQAKEKQGSKDKDKTEKENDNEKDGEKDKEKDKDKNKDKDKDPSRSTSGKGISAASEQKKKWVRFRVPAKFVVKCHTPDGDYACVLCCGPRGEYSGGVLLCDDPEALVEHVSRDHKVSDIEKEIDIIVG